MTANLGVTANVLTDLRARTQPGFGHIGRAGQLTITSSLTDRECRSPQQNPTGTLNYNATGDGRMRISDIDGVPLTSASNTVTNLIPGVTFQLLAPSRDGIRVPWSRCRW
jgi:flagellar hook-associated protein 2